MSLRVAVQMDPIENVNIAGDSSFALIEAGQARGHTCYEYHVESLTLDADDRLFAECHPVTVQRVEGDHVTKGAAQRLDLGKDIDVVLMRQDPPFNMGYITATHMLERIKDETLVVNDPVSVRNAPEKVMVLNYRRFMPPTLVTRSVDEVRRFMAEHGAVVVKPIHGNGGKAIFRVPADGDNLSALFEVFNQTWPEPHMVQPFLPEVAEGDKRIVLVDGVVAGAINRRPGEGEFRSNLAMGGSAEATELTEREQEICDAMGPELKRLGLTFVGIDVIGGKYLTEINVTSPTGIVAIDKFNGTDTAGMIWGAIEGRVAKKG
ncbi:glutathione synthase [Altererythrobacter sp.]|uniref:glutathione synthase n=1 Tax=Altererythrobacter sp. TaxID=1872480 RepID=UPI001B01BF96|nr:glutathione synthase [Altererythrobacter sp.]MBO6608357.1 glutathione synthase [Altererythrobacter sp.]MBO6641386.1 glutathione synthase [Altererythrobacter sp.]MBO6707916.1 glutathione synthase [Altererythrobacter sp.]MBO6945953.1 glutathione synthase [Altererythrobacter sp.]